MRTRLSDELVLTIKDQLRTMRFRIKRGARGGGAPNEGVAPGATALAADAVFSHFEAAAAALLPKDEVALYHFSFPQPAASYFGDDPEELMSPKIYSALKYLLGRLGADVFLISEHAVHEACGRVLKRQYAAIAALLDSAGSAQARFDACVTLCADISAALIAAQPVREAIGVAPPQDASRSPFLAPNEYCAFVIGLAMALSSRADVEGADPEVLLEAAEMAVYACLGELAGALKRRHASGALAAQFKDILRFLP